VNGDAQRHHPSPQSCIQRQPQRSSCQHALRGDGAAARLGWKAALRILLQSLRAAHGKCAESSFELALLLTSSMKAR
jgi:hypothetical protein